MSGFQPRDVDRPDAPHPAPHWKHVVRHRYRVEIVNENDVWAYVCCDHPRLHPIHLNRNRNRRDL